MRGPAGLRATSSVKRERAHFYAPYRHCLNRAYLARRSSGLHLEDHRQATMVFVAMIEGLGQSASCVILSPSAFLVWVSVSCPFKAERLRDPNRPVVTLACPSEVCLRPTWLCGLKPFRVGHWGRLARNSHRTQREAGSLSAARPRLRRAA